MTVISVDFGAEKARKEAHMVRIQLQMSGRSIIDEAVFTHADMEAQRVMTQSSTIRCLLHEFEACLQQKSPEKSFDKMKSYWKEFV